MTDVANNFSRGALNYATSADFQKAIAKQLFDFYPLKQPCKILEVGCGTGFLSRHYQQAFNEASYIAVDISEGMLSEYQKRVGFGKIVLADAEDLNFEINSLDAIVSASTIQWFKNLSGTLKKYYNFLKPGSDILISTFGESFFKEFFAYVPAEFKKNMPNFYNQEILKDIFNKAGFVDIKTKQYVSKQQFKDAKSMLRNMNNLGFGPLGDRPLSHGDMRKLLRDLSKQSYIELSYDTVLLKATKPV